MFPSTFLLASLLLAACGDKGSDDSGSSDGGGTTDGGSDGGTDGGGGDTATDGGSDGGGSDGGMGEQVKVGSGVQADGAYNGTETLTFITDKGKGDLVCQVHYDLSSTAPRTDCADCDWAYDLVVSNVVVDTDDACAAIGYDKAGLAALDGSSRAYGFTPDYFGHAPALLFESDGTWGPATFATYDETTGAFGYEWHVGYFPY